MDVRDYFAMERWNWNRILKIAILAGLALYYLYREFRVTSTGSKKADTELEAEQTERPKTGELDFEQ